MITYRKLSAAGAGKLIVAYLRENQLEPTKDARFDRDRNDPTLESGDRLNTYYTGRDGKGAWAPNMGDRITAALGIDVSKIPTDEACARLYECKRADNGEAWANMGRKREISGFDFTASPAKSVGVALEFAGTKAEQALIWLAIHRANDRTMAFIGREVGVARRGSGKHSYVEAGEVAWVSYRHHTARPVQTIQDGPAGPTASVEIPVPGDPQPHIHNILLNAVATASGHLGSLDSARITKTTSHLFGAYFQAELARELRALGIRVRVDERGRAICIEAIPQEVCDLFSKRSKQAERQAKAYVKRQGRDWNTLSADQKFKILHQANLTFRAKKYNGANEREIWREQAAEIGWTHDTVLTGEVYPELSDTERFDMAYDIASKMLAEEFRTAAVIDHDMFRTHATHGLIAAGIKQPEDIAHVVSLIEQRGIMIDDKQVRFLIHEQDGRTRVATSEQIRVEKEMARLAGKASQRKAGALTEEAIAAAIERSGLDFTREPEHGQAQLAAIRSLGLAGGLAFLTGVAGAGKTTLLRPLVDAWQTQGREVVGTAISWRQAEALRDAGIGSTFALTPLLQRLASGKLELGETHVLVIDEVSQVSPRQMLQILELQQQRGFALRVLGDREQAQAIEAGDSVELLMRALPSEVRPELLSTVRQKSARGRAIAERFRSPGRDLTMTEDEQREADRRRAREAIDMKRQDGSIRLAGGDHEQVIAHIADLYLKRRDILRQCGMTRGITVSAPTNQDVMDLSIAIRQRLRARGEIGRDEIVRPAVDQRGEIYDLQISVGDRLRLFDRVQARVNTPHGPRSREIGSNGDFVVVRGWSDEGLHLENAKGRTGFVPWVRFTDRKTGRLRLGFGHAMTQDAAQGITSDEHINAMPRGSSAVTGFTSYVGESRHVYQCWTVVAEAALREAEAWSRPLGDIRPITNDDLYDRLAADMGRHPYKALAVDLAKSSEVADEQATRWISQCHENERVQKAGGQPGSGFRKALSERPVRAVSPEQWDDVGRKLRKTAYATQAALDATRRLNQSLDEAGLRRSQRQRSGQHPQRVREDDGLSRPAPSLDP
ncbi:relaxase domain-containing protein [Gluconacetobacter diazotrophicus]|uniref:Relaxase domain-containing protein n=1 Tax=Gluconacetobacter diazotrophicus TaxID=33996 RepID=A0A7W4I8B6_GLUDI|nr:MobF family relaxase [Gluconacetobacter diazotrophicus]MBB2158090.1 relaxase domain-containing protein [Gluconacetobacter diazotrophicus]